MSDQSRENWTAHRADFSGDRAGVCQNGKIEEAENGKSPKSIGKSFRAGLDPVISRCGFARSICWPSLRRFGRAGADLGRFSGFLNADLVIFGAEKIDFFPRARSLANWVSIDASRPTVRADVAFSALGRSGTALGRIEAGADLVIWGRKIDFAYRARSFANSVPFQARRRSFYAATSIGGRARADISHLRAKNRLVAQELQLSKVHGPYMQACF